MKWTAGVERRVLPNGLTVLVCEDHSAPVVAVVTHVRAGYFDEPDEWVGIAHVLEHMFFKGTARRGPGDVARDTQLLGGYLNAGTIYDKTVYYTVLPSTDGGLERAVDIQADALMHSALDEGELASELEVIIQEAKRKLDTPTAVARETLYELLFSVHRMRRWRIGTEDGLRRLTAADVREYYTSRYTPDRTIVGIVGNVHGARALDLAVAVYGGWQRPSAVIEGSPPEPDRSRPSRRVLRGDVNRGMACVGWRTVDAMHADAPALDVAAVVLGSGRGSRLYQAVRAPGLASSAHATHYTPTEVGVFSLEIEGESDDLDRAVSKSCELVWQLGQRGPAEVELERARALVASRWARQFESMDGRASTLCEGEALGRYQVIDELYEATMRVGSEDVRRVVAKHLCMEHASAVSYLPESGGAETEGEEWPPQMGDVDAGWAAPQILQVGATSADRVVSEDEVAPGILHRAYDGIDVLARTKRGTGLVSVALHVAGLPWHETGETAGMSRLLARSAVRGAGGMSEEQLAQAAEILGGGVAWSTSVDGVTWSMTIRAEEAGRAAELLRLVALEPTLAEADVRVERALQASDARRLRDDMHQYPVQRVIETAFAGDSYGLPQLGDPAVIEVIEADGVRRWADLLRGRRAVAVAVGDLEPEALLDALGPVTAWPVEGETAPDDRRLPFAFDHGVEHRDKAQTALAMAFRAVPYGAEERHALVVLGALLSGLAGRLFAELRDKRSLAYTVAASPWLRRRDGAMLTYIATSPDREDEARVGMLAELTRLLDQSVSEEELQRARNYAAGLAEIRQQSGTAVASDILTGWTFGTIRELPVAPERLRAVTAVEVASAAQMVFGGGERAEFVVRGTGKTR